MMVGLIELLAVCVGLLISSRLPAYSRSERLAIALALGLAFFLWLPYLSARVWGINQGAWISFAILALLAGSALVWLLSVGSPDGGWRIPNKMGSPALSHWRSGLVLIIITVILGYLLFNLSLRVRNGGLWSAGSGCEDMGFHATLANAFFHSQERILRPTYPIFPNWPLGYPFLPDFSAATAMALGSSIGFGFFATGAFAILALISNLYCLARRWLMPAYSVLAIFLFLFGGNLGVIFFLRDLPASGLFSSIWLQDYANNFNLSLNYGNITTDVLLPMRTSLFGAPIAFAIILIFSRVPAPALWEKIVGGVLLGSLPLINAHSFLVASICIGVYCFRDPLREQRWWPSVLVAAIFAVPQLYWVHQQVIASAIPFIRRANGFLFETQLNWPTYWLLNGGLFVPLAIWAWFFAKRDLKFMTFPLIMLLPLSMAVSFQPNPFDNIKLLLFFHLGSAILIAHFCQRNFQSGRGRAAIAVAAVMICTASGFLSWIREANTPCEMATAADREFGAQVLSNTDEHSMILTGQHYTHPVPFLTGRTIVLGFHNWLAMTGIPFEKRATDVIEIYSGTKRAPELIAKYGITDIVIGPVERREFPGLNEGFLAKISNRKITSGGYTMYRLRR
jgi:hypothetical protein